MASPWKAAAVSVCNSALVSALLQPLLTAATQLSEEAILMALVQLGTSRRSRHPLMLFTSSTTSFSWLLST